MPIRLLPVLALTFMLAAAGCSPEPSASPRAADDASPTAPARAPAAPAQSAPGPVSSPRETAAQDTAAKPAAAEALEVDPAARPWRDPSGKVLAAGELVSVMEGKVCLQTPTGGGAVVPLDQLCDEDRRFALKTAGEDLAPANTEARPPGPKPPAAKAASPGEPPPARPVEPAGGADSYTHEKVVVPFDFVSKFDNGRYGSMVGEMIWKKLEREGGVIIPESMVDVRDLCAAGHVEITPQTPLADVGRVVRQTFDADVGIWGSVERAPGHEWEVYDLTIKCVDFSRRPPQVIYQVSGVRTNSVSEIPHLYVKQMLDKLYGRQPGGPPPVDALAEENWQKNPNLVAGGDFQHGAGGVPTGWEAAGGQQREPLGNLVKWVPDTAGSPGERVIRFTFDKGVGDGYGVMYYSKPFPVEEGATYRFQCRWRSNGPNVKVFIKCYDQMESEYKAASQARRDPPPPPRSVAGAAPSGAEYVPEVGQLRECYRAQFNMKGSHNAWHVHTQDFTPKHTKYTPSIGRVMLYAYLGAGVVEFDDVVIKQIIPASPSESKKVRRHSLESNVTIEEMRANERRAGQIGKEKEKEKDQKQRKP